MREWMPWLCGAGRRYRTAGKGGGLAYSGPLIDGRVGRKPPSVRGPVGMTTLGDRIRAVLSPPGLKQPGQMDTRGVASCDIRRALRERQPSDNGLESVLGGQW